MKSSGVRQSKICKSLLGFRVNQSLVLVACGLIVGVPEQLIKLHGDWRSDAYQVYLSLPLSTRTQVADIMAAGLFTNTSV